MGAAAVKHVQDHEALLSEMAAALKVPAESSRSGAVDGQENPPTEKASSAGVAATLSVDKLLDDAVEVAGVKSGRGRVPGGPAPCGS